MGYYETYDYSPMESNSIATVLMIYLLFFVVWGIYALVCYIIKGIGLYTIAKAQGEEYPWLAFVPFARTYLQGELGGEILLKKKSIRNPGIWLIVLPFIEGAVFMIFYLLMFGVIGLSAFSTMSYSNSTMGMGAGTIGTMVILMVLFILILIAFGAIAQVLRILVNHQILERFTTKNMSIAHAILMGVIPLYEPICFFIMSRRVNGQNHRDEGTTPESGFVVQRGLLNPEQPMPQEQPVAEEQPAVEEQPVVVEQPVVEEQPIVEEQSEMKTETPPAENE